MPKNTMGQAIGFPLVNFQTPERPPITPMDGRYCRIEHLDIARHAAALHDANNKDTEHRNWTYLPYGPFTTLDDYTRWMEEACCNGDPLFHSIIDNTSGEAVGLASYLRIDPRNASIEVGHINFSPLLQRTVAATESMFLLMQRAFALGYRRYEWKCDALNKPSQQAAQRLGFRYEGTFRQATHYKNRNRDTAWYSIIDTEWPTLQTAFQHWLAVDNFDPNGRQRLSLSALTSAARDTL